MRRGDVSLLLSARFKETLSRLKYLIFMIMSGSLLSAHFIILKLEKTIAKGDRSKEI